MAGSTSIFDGGNPIALPGGWLALFLLQVMIVMLFCRILAIPLKYIGQPRVISEVLVGIILGPSAMGYIPGFSETVFPPASLPQLAVVANLGLIFFLFLIGMELDPSVLRAQAKKAVFTSIGGIVVPFALGAAVSWLIYNTYMLEPQVGPTGVVKPVPPFGSFLAFMGVAMSITAFPVLARILTEKSLLQTPVGTATIAAAAVDDVVAWTLLALVVSVVNATNLLNALYIFLVAAAWAAVVIFGIRRLLRKMVMFTEAPESVNHPLGRMIPVSELSIFVMFIFLFISSFITEIVGIHAIFGAFLAGIATPHEHGFSHKLTEKVEDLVTLVFIPLYFTASGLRTQIGLLNDWQSWGFVVLVTLTACVGKIAGCTAASKLSGMPWRESWAVGVLMNTKGLVEIIVLNLGLDAGVINVKVFTIMVLMAIITTLMTSPLIQWVYPPKFAFANQTLDSDSDEHDEEAQVKQYSTGQLNTYALLETSDLMVPVGQGKVDGILVAAKMMSQPAHYTTSRPNHLLGQTTLPKIHLLRLFELDGRMSSIGLASAAAFSQASVQTNLSTISVNKGNSEDQVLEANMDYTVTYAAKPTWPEELVARGIQKKVRSFC
jgi:Kef-type K+ transport system membrane component KefB